MFAPFDLAILRGVRVCVCVSIDLNCGIVPPSFIFLSFQLPQARSLAGLTHTHTQKKLNATNTEFINKTKLREKKITNDSAERIIEI